MILGIVQGFTELLPVSSSGHLVLVEKLMGVELKDVSFEISVHVATALALCVVLRREIWLMLRSLLPTRKSKAGGSGEGRPQVGISQTEVLHGEKQKGRLLILAIIAGSIPAALVGLALSDQIEAVFHGVTLTVAMLPLTGVFLILTRWAKDRGRGVGVARGFIIGIAQAIAILPGISRSGMTVGSGLLLGIAKEDAVKFSFLLSIPAIGGAALFKLVKGFDAGAGAGVGVSGIGVPGVGLPGIGAQNLAIASVVAFISALAAARLLLGVVRRGKLVYFGYYCLGIGVLGLFLLAR